MDYTNNYRFICKVVDEDTDEVLALGSTYINPDSIGTAGECESVDMEVGSVMRAFKKKWQQSGELFEDIKEDEPDWDTDAEKERFEQYGEDAMFRNA